MSLLVCTIACFCSMYRVAQQVPESLVLVSDSRHVPLDIMRQRIPGTNMEMHGPWYEKCHQQDVNRQCSHS